MNSKARRLFREIRRKHPAYPVRSAWMEAKRRASVERLAYHELIRIDVRPDDCYSMEGLEGDTFNLDCNPDIPPAQMERERAAFHEEVSRDGVWGIVGQYRLDDESPWIDSEYSCWGFVGDHWRDSGYDIDALVTARDELAEALRNRCPICRSVRRC